MGWQFELGSDEWLFWCQLTGASAVSCQVSRKLLDLGWPQLRQPVPAQHDLHSLACWPGVVMCWLIMLRTGTMSLLPHFIGQIKLQSHLRLKGWGDSVSWWEELQSHTVNRGKGIIMAVFAIYHSSAQRSLRKKKGSHLVLGLPWNSSCWPRTASTRKGPLTALTIPDMQTQYLHS